MIYADIKSQIRLVFIGITLLLAAFIFIGSLGPVTTPTTITNGDKLVHFLAYGALGFFALPAFSKLKPALIWGGVTLFGGFIELLQGSFFAARHADLLDAVANASGALLAVLAWIIISRVWPTLSPGRGI